MSKYKGMVISNLIARVGRNDGLKTVEGSTDQFVNLRLAFQKVWPDKNEPSGFGRKTTWTSATAWNELAKRIAETPKGVEVLVDGEIQSRETVDRGEKRERHSLRLSSMTVISVPNSKEPAAVEGTEVPTID
jgi:single-stranded DNA-binding protein